MASATSLSIQRAQARWSILFCASWNTLTLTALESSTLLKGIGIWYDRGICVISTKCTLHKIIAKVKTSSCCVCDNDKEKRRRAVFHYCQFLGTVILIFHGPPPPQAKATNSVQVLKFHIITGNIRVLFHIHVCGLILWQANLFADFPLRDVS